MPRNKSSAAANAAGTSSADTTPTYIVMPKDSVKKQLQTVHDAEDSIRASIEAAKEELLREQQRLVQAAASAPHNQHSYPFDPVTGSAGKESAPTDSANGGLVKCKQCDKRVIAGLEPELCETHQTEQGKALLTSLDHLLEEASTS